MNGDERPELDEDAVDQIGQRAGAELRRPPPPGAARRVASAGHRRRVTRNAMIGAVTAGIVAVGGVAIVAVRHSVDDESPPVATIATSTTGVPESTAVETTVTTPSTSHTAAPSTTAPPPETQDVDQLAGWPAAPTDLPTLDVVPMFRPPADPPGTVRVERAEWQPTADGQGLPQYFQGWVDPAAGAELTITTRLYPDINQQLGAVMDFPGWDSASLLPTGGETTHFALRDPSGYVTVWARGLPTDTVRTIASSLTRRATSAGWEIDTTGTGLAPVDDTWNGSRAERVLLWFDDQAVIAQLSVSFGDVTLDTGGGVGEQVGLADIDGALALTGTYDHAANVAWSPAPGVTVFVGLRGSLEDTLLFARSLTLVDRATWEAGTIVRTDDGCASLFC